MGRPKKVKAAVGDAAIEIENFNYIIGLIAPLAERAAVLERELDPINEKLHTLRKTAKNAAGSAWNGAAKRAATAWKSINGDAPLAIAWVDENHFAQLPTAISEMVEGDLIEFFDQVKEEIEGEE